jgi:hypothetical protein
VLTTKTKIIINGQEFSDIDQMPPDVRQQYDKAMSLLADRDGNGVPDILEGKANPNSSNTAGNSVVIKRTTSRVIVNGRECTADGLPSAVKSLLSFSASSNVAGSPPLVQKAVAFRLNRSTIFAIISVLSLGALVCWILRW